MASKNTLCYLTFIYKIYIYFYVAKEKEKLKSIRWRNQKSNRLPLHFHYILGSNPKTQISFPISTKHWFMLDFTPFLYIHICRHRCIHHMQTRPAIINSRVVRIWIKTEEVHAKSPSNSVINFNWGTLSFILIFFNMVACVSSMNLNCWLASKMWWFCLVRSVICRVIDVDLGNWMRSGWIVGLGILDLKAANFECYRTIERWMWFCGAPSK